jgi:hypothetical protein
LLGIVPAAISVVALSILSALVQRISGVRVLKYDWLHTEGSTREEEPSAPPRGSDNEK